MRCIKSYELNGLDHRSTKTMFQWFTTKWSNCGPRVTPILTTEILGLNKAKPSENYDSTRKAVEPCNESSSTIIIKLNYWLIMTIIHWEYRRRKIETRFITMKLLSKMLHNTSTLVLWKEKHITRNNGNFIRWNILYI